MTKTFKFVDFWNGFDWKKDPFFSKLKNFDNLTETQGEPDFLFFSVFGNNNRKFQKSIKVFYSAENHLAGNHVSEINSNDFDSHFEICDYALTCYNFKHPKHFRLPLYFRRFGFDQLYNLELNKKKFLKEKNKFCAFVFSNSSVLQAHHRNNFMNFISKNYKTVDCAGKCFNNLGFLAPRDHEGYMNFLSDYKFVISFENSLGDGYTTEKIIHSYMANTVPVYWGNPTVEKEINKDSMIYVEDFEDALERIRLLDNSPEEFNKILKEEIFNKHFLKDLSDSSDVFLEKIIRNGDVL